MAVKCKYCINEICVNADCPMRTEFCPVYDVEGVCKYEDRGKVKPCPFCGNEVSVALGGDDDHQWWFITRGVVENRCTCNIFMESEWFYKDTTMDEKLRIKQQLIEEWNRRADNG